MREKTSDRARGKWRDILTTLGVSPTLIDGKHHSCPWCGGKDRFRFTDFQGSGGYICNQCRGGSGFDLLMKIHGWDFKTAAEEVDRVVGTCATDLRSADRSDAAKRAAMTSLWKSARMLCPEDPAGRYLWNRCRLTHFPSCLRFASTIRSGGAENYPAMLAMVTSSDGKPNTIHRTFLTESGSKAPIKDPRRLMPGSIAKGAAVRLTVPAETLGIAEGIETALSATALTGIPCWAAVNAAMLKGWQPPNVVTRVIIFADHDENFTGQAAAYALAHRLQNDDRRVTIRMPEQSGQDWNDVHRLVLQTAAEHSDATMASPDRAVAAVNHKVPADTISNRQHHQYGS